MPYLCKFRHRLMVLLSIEIILRIMSMGDILIGSYGSTLRYKSVERIKPIGKHSLLGASGEISDFQEILRYLDELM